MPKGATSGGEASSCEWDEWTAKGKNAKYGANIGPAAEGERSSKKPHAGHLSRLRP